MDLEQLTIRPLSRTELDVAAEWAAAEGWNPGRHDADVFWESDPHGFLGVEWKGELVATGSVVSYGGRYGFMGFFIVREDLRGAGIGTRFWFHRRDHLRSRLRAGAAIGMDGVFAMQDWYARGGFRFSHRNLRMEGIGERRPPVKQIVELSTLPFSAINAYDLAHFGCERQGFLRGWLALPDSLSLGFVRGDRLCGYGVIRRCRIGCKIGPLFADDSEVAESLFAALSGFAEGESVWLDIPEHNPAAGALAKNRGMKEVFGCARMYFGSEPVLPWGRIFGITTFELG